MTNFQGELVEDKRKTNYAMEIRYDNDMFQNRSVSIKNIDEYIYSTIISAYAFDLGSLHKQ